MKTSEKEGSLTAKDIAARRGCQSLISLLEPSIHHHIAAERLVRLEARVHNLMRRLAGAQVRISVIS